MTTPASPADRLATTGPMRILLVEDDAGDALLVEELLADTGLDHVLSWNKNLGEARAHAAGHVTDVVLLDLHLPDASGVGAVAAIREAAPSAAVVVLTGLAESEAGARMVAAGAQDYLVKGEVPPELMERVLRYAAYRKQAEQAAAELLERRMQAAENVRLERGLLPAPLLHGTDVSACMRIRPGRQRALLGGDFLDVVQTEDGIVHAVIGDVCGHGPDEAALGVALRISWRALTMTGLRGTALLDALERVLVAEQPHQLFATCVLVEIDRARAEATVVLAGHHPPLLVSGGTAVEITAEPGIALGLLPGHGGWQPAKVRLPREDAALMLYTDGLIEGRAGDDGARLDTEGLIDLIVDAGIQEPDKLLDHLVTTTQALNAGRHADDLAILHLSWVANGVPPGRIATGGRPALGAGDSKPPLPRHEQDGGPALAPAPERQRRR